jgi:hypothetical protein
VSHAQLPPRSLGQVRLLHADSPAACRQARWRGYSTRKKLREGAEAFLEAERAKAEGANAEAARRAELAAELQRQRQRAGGGAGAGGGGGGAAAGGRDAGGAVAAEPSLQAAGMLAAARATHGRGRCGGGEEWSPLVPATLCTPCLPPWPPNTPLPAAPRRRSWPRGRFGQPATEPSAAAAGGHESDESGGWSDVELDDVAAIKLRAATPPWQLPAAAGPGQRAGGGAWGGSSGARARSRGGVGPQAWRGLARGLCPLPGDAPSSRLTQLRHRRWARPPEGAAPPPRGADGEAAGGGDAGDDDAPGAQLSSSAPLPRGVIDGLLLPRYAAKFERLGVPHKAPGGWRMRQLLEAEAMRAAAAAAAAQRARGDACNAEGRPGGAQGPDAEAAAAGGLGAPGGGQEPAALEPTAADAGALPE